MLEPFQPLNQAKDGVLINARQRLSDSPCPRPKYPSLNNPLGLYPKPAHLSAI